MPDLADLPDRLLWAPKAWVAGRWKAQVLLRVGTDGCWAAVTPGVAQPPASATVLAGPVLPGLVNAHSHAFQRAFAGQAEQRDSAADDFWSWRDRMYRVALRVSPEQLRAVATQLYVELLRGGYTHVCEFHYLQHQPDGQPHADPLEMAWALVDAAADAGIGLTLLPVLYERAGFAAATLRDDQRRFAAGAEDVWRLAQALQHGAQGGARPGLTAGLAVHSLRAAAPQSVHQLRRLADGFAGPIHIHVAEQTAEVDDCIATTGARPIEWLTREGLLDARWQLVHATHTTRDEIDAVARSGAGVVLCPSTEANLGDGLADLPGWLAAGVPLSIGSDSHVGRAWREELRWLDYGQRLALRKRNVAAGPEAGQPSTAARMFNAMLAGGEVAAGRLQPQQAKPHGLAVGARADALVVDLRDTSLLGLPADRLLDALVFSSPGRPWRDVLAGGRWVVRNHHHAAAERAAQRFEAAMQALWAEG